MSDAEAQAASEASPGITAEPSPEPETSTSSEPAEELAPEAAPGATTESITESPIDDPADHRFECLSCGFVYDPEEGIKKLKIAAGIPFLELDPASFRCPVCRSKMGAFKDIGPRNKPSGFEENLNFGLGVNRLTPGQKNVLIFGGFALAVAFFLSLYSLR
jgi:rubredoxin